MLGIRPEAFNDAAHARPHLPRIEVTVDVLEELGSDAFVFFHVAAPRVTIESRVASEDEASLLVEEDTFFTARVEAMTSAQVGASLQLAVDPSTLSLLRSSDRPDPAPDPLVTPSCGRRGLAHLPMPAVSPRTKNRCPQR